MYTEDEFSDIVTIDGKQITISVDEIGSKYNSDEFNPRDGELLKAIDELAAFIEAFMALNNGLSSLELQDAKNRLKERYKLKVVAGIKFGELYADFE
jgi:putative hydrolase of HD superfamily